MHARIRHVDRRVEDRCHQVVADEDPDELAVQGKNLRHGKEHHSARGQRQAHRQEIGTHLAEARVRAVDDKAHQDVRAAVDQLGDGEDRDRFRRSERTVYEIVLHVDHK